MNSCNRFRALQKWNYGRPASLIPTSKFALQKARLLIFCPKSISVLRKVNAVLSPFLPSSSLKRWLNTLTEWVYVHTTSIQRLIPLNVLRSSMHCVLVTSMSSLESICYEKDWTFPRSVLLPSLMLTVKDSFETNGHCCKRLDELLETRMDVYCSMLIA